MNECHQTYTQRRAPDTGTLVTVLLHCMHIKKMQSCLVRPHYKLDFNERNESGILGSFAIVLMALKGGALASRASWKSAASLVLTNAPVGGWWLKEAGDALVRLGLAHLEALGNRRVQGRGSTVPGTEHLAAPHLTRIDVDGIARHRVQELQFTGGVQHPVAAGGSSTPLDQTASITQWQRKQHTQDGAHLALDYATPRQPPCLAPACIRARPTQCPAHLQQPCAGWPPPCHAPSGC